MEKISFSFLIITGSCCWGEKYVFVESLKKNWADAKDYCEEHYTNILSLTSAEEEQVFKRYMIKAGDEEGWIGMYWDQDSKKWKWWGEDFVNYTTLDLPHDEPGISKNVYWTKDKWQWKPGTSSKSFFCLNMLVVKERKTWEDALEHCRKNDEDLTSLLSETENSLAQSKIQHSALTQQLWIGMRYLGDSWMWVNGDPVQYRAWLTGEDQDYQCPRLRRCGALTKGGKWENRDCQEKLSFICAKVKK